MSIAIACATALTSANSSVAQSFSFDDIRFWVGAGSNRAALAIDWVENSTSRPALVWGYRWDGSATGANMLTAVLAADPLLFAKLGGTAAKPVAVYGLGYDADGDEQFALCDNTAFDPNGIAFTGSSDLVKPKDRRDYYAEGWFTGFWHYGIAARNPYDGVGWSDTPKGMASRPLADGAWDSWAFSSTFSFTAFAENPVAAVLMPGDFDGSSHVDASDYAAWLAAFGSTQQAADANGNQVVDAADYIIWRSHYHPESEGFAVGSQQVPEPCGNLLVLTLLALYAARGRGTLIFANRR